MLGPARPYNDRIRATGSQPVFTCQELVMSVRPDRDTLIKAGIVTDRSLCLENQELNLISIIVPFTGAALAVASIPVLGVTSSTLFVFAIFFIATSAGIELGLHRYFTHRAFRTGKIFRTILGVPWYMGVSGTDNSLGRRPQETSSLYRQDA